MAASCASGRTSPAGMRPFAFAKLLVPVQTGLPEASEAWEVVTPSRQLLGRPAPLVQPDSPSARPAGSRGGGAFNWNQPVASGKVDSRLGGD